MNYEVWYNPQYDILFVTHKHWKQAAVYIDSHLAFLLTRRSECILLGDL